MNSLTQLFFRTGCFMPHIISTTAAELQRCFVQDQSAEGFYGVAKNSKILLLDDLGCEPENCIIYGTSYHPISEIIYHRYCNQPTTILTINLTDNELASRYGPRIMDRLEESFDFIAYTNPSYRKRWKSIKVLKYKSEEVWKNKYAKTLLCLGCATEKQDVFLYYKNGSPLLNWVGSLRLKCGW